MWSGGNYTKGNNATGGWVGDASLGIGIEAGRHDTQDDDFATGINQCLNKDGSNPAAGNLNLGGNKLTNVAVGTASTDAITLGQAQGGIDVQSTTLSVDNTQFSNDSTPGEINLRKSRGAAVGTNTIVQNSDFLGALRFWGATGSGYAQGAAISAIVDLTPGAGTDMPTALQFFTSPDGTATPTERMRISSNGQVSIGTTSTGSILFIQNDQSNSIPCISIKSNVAGDLGTSALNIVKYDNDSTTSQVMVRFLMNGAFAGQGQINANGAFQVAFGSYSDERLKENIVNLPSQLANIFALRPVEFDYKDGFGHQIGFIAQEVRDIYPDLVGNGQDGFLTLSGLGKNEARMIKAFQEFAQLTQAKVEALEARIAALEA